ncbi:MAG TPA: universal stress protein [Candidatus Elarobacter sp.]|jgi:hypothetical protein|nr:universal stress protein [Candidatus Elarobacter sp.]
MHLCVAFDGSDDAYDSLSALVGLFDPARTRRVTVAVLAWPLRESPIWEKALERRIEVDDLHEAMAEVVERETLRLRALFSDRTKVETMVGEGDPVEAMLSATAGDPPDLVLIGVTGGLHRRAVLGVVGEFLARTPFRVVVANGKSH